ncbi:hypothetical protein [Dolichospermum circinale]|uniref:Uncharacterized protein n=1 Tax=Dolichospermum circinale CS-537/01 TaxID=3021739 RepID=A0ABT5A9I4_9CYAN|nr:hypothetical protein [Dolichospermum circinale]MDB9464782.1 hypothetical protein [Dolichospermum circinale CS-541/04]MDB9474880.1 hypothetical protein [Dolichospermum circinale CS-537/11]MDB9478567.1 hypothetical protein [Dolichospermum circinale CS-537/03]MDB9488631.1 hypothetical protein [Dolichospermum circinale CS-537/01]MDB9491022.1 hypothetical protein [Dolichospermum circinale CS-534/05]
MTIWTQGEYMHFEILVEDISGKTTLDILVPKIINPEQHTFTALPGVMRYISSGQDARTTRVS